MSLVMLRRAAAVAPRAQLTQCRAFAGVANSKYGGTNHLQKELDMCVLSPGASFSFSWPS